MEFLVFSCGSLSTCYTVETAPSASMSSCIPTALPALIPSAVPISLDTFIYHVPPLPPVLLPPKIQFPLPLPITALLDSVLYATVQG